MVKVVKNLRRTPNNETYRESEILFGICGTTRIALWQRQQTTTTDIDLETIRQRQENHMTARNVT
jgi:hypothetical protein